MRYQIISAHSLIDLEKMVNNELRHAWEVTGGLICYVVMPLEMLKEPRQFFAQAMISHAPAQPK